MPLGSDNYVLAGRLRFGQISGAPLFNIAPPRRLYAGGRGSVRGSGYQAIGPTALNSDPIAGRSRTEAALQSRIRSRNLLLRPCLAARPPYHLHTTRTTHLTSRVPPPLH